MRSGSAMATVRGGCITLLATLMAAATPFSSRAQVGAPREVVVLQGRQLVFGSLIPGVPEAVSIVDAGRRAELVLEGSGTVELMLLLPQELTSQEGGRVPLRFAAGDAAILHPGSVDAVRFDPNRPVSVSLNPDRGPTRILLGGTALPSESQGGGSYTTAIGVTVVHTSN